MTSQHTTRCFFGCNAGSGFHTFFNFLPRLEGARIIIVKGGPGTGKSTFISAIGETFAQQGYDLEYQHCSLDPQSYDAVVVPALKAGLIEYTVPESPTSRNQKYRLTVRGEFAMGGK